MRREHETNYAKEQNKLQTQQTQDKSSWLVNESASALWIWRLTDSCMALRAVCDFLCQCETGRGVCHCLFKLIVSGFQFHTK